MRNALLIAALAAAALAVITSWPQPSRPSLRSPPSAAPAPALPPPSAAAVPVLSAVPPTAATLTDRARAQLERDPAAALRDIEQADRLAGPGDERRRALEIVAFVRLGRVGHARALTDRFYRSFPDSAEVPQLERLTGYHPRPYGP